MSSVPKAVNYLIEEVSEMRAALDHIEKQLGLGADKHRPILIERAAEILQMKVGTVRRFVNNREIPHYKPNGKCVYFDKVEIEEWMKQNRILTTLEAEQGASAYMVQKGGAR